MGVHTGDSITIAPALTLTDKEYQRMRDASVAVLRKIGVDTGGSNVQFAINPSDGRLLVIEMNPRVSRSSALASKATGFPIAKIAAKLAVGYTLDELKNDITAGATPASFEPSIDYVVTKIPRFTFEKFPAANDRLTTQMKSVGEVMAIGRTFQESLQKALRGLETGLEGLNPQLPLPLTDESRDRLAHELRAPGADRLLYVADAFRAGWPVARGAELTRIDPWFPAQIEELVEHEAQVREHGVEPLPREAVLEMLAKERPEGVIVQFGGQTRLKLSRALEAAGAPIIGASPDSIDIAEDRERFQILVRNLGLKQPANATARTEDQAVRLAREVGFPLVARPSYVLGGRPMEGVFNEDDLRAYMTHAIRVSNDTPVLLDRYLDVAIEVDVDAVCDGEDVLIGGVMEHIEQAGVHSGDSGCSLPPNSLSAQVQAELREQTRKLAKALNVVGLMNVQFAIQNRLSYVL